MVTARSRTTSCATRCSPRRAKSLRARVQADVERILTIYRRSGRYNASVEPKVIKLDQGRVDVEAAEVVNAVNAAALRGPSGPLAD